MKKIKINVLTKEKKEERARAEAQRKAILEQEPKSVTSNVLNPTNQEAITAVQSTLALTAYDDAPTTPDLIGPDQAALMAGITPHTPHTAPPAVSSTKAEEASAIPLEYGVNPIIKEELAPSTPSFEPVMVGGAADYSPTTPTAPPAELDLFVPYQPEGPPATSLPFSGPIQILEPNMGTPAQYERKAAVDRADLVSPSLIKFSRPNKLAGHQFTASSKLAFAAPPPPTRSPTSQNGDVKSAARPGSEHQSRSEPTENDRPGS